VAYAYLGQSRHAPLFHGQGDGLSFASVLRASAESLKLLSMGLGPGLQSPMEAVEPARALFYVGNYLIAPQVWPASAVFVLIVVCTAVVQIIATWNQASSQWLRLLGLSLFMVSLLLVAVAIAWGRSPDGPTTLFRSRYALLATPLWCAVYFVGMVCRPHMVGRCLCASLFLAVCFLSQGNYAEGMFWGQRTRAIYEEFERDMRAGMPVKLLVENYAERLHVPFHSQARPDVEFALKQLKTTNSRWGRELSVDQESRGIPVNPSELAPPLSPRTSTSSTRFVSAKTPDRYGSTLRLHGWRGQSREKSENVRTAIIDPGGDMRR
jgi:hypothetical protein